MGKALTNVEVASRLIKWATELGEYNIVYQPRTAIKAQALADFLTEIHQPDSEETWRVYVDGSATRQGSDVGVLLISPQEDVLQLAVQLNFRATNNEVEYEALLEAYEKMKQEFKEVIISKIPISENGKADELSKMDSSLTTWVLDRPTTQTFLIAQIDLQNNMDEIIDWRAPMISYLQQGTLPTDLEQARLIKKKVHAFTMVGDQLYKRAFSRPLLKCISIEEADQVLREMHLGCCGSHAGGRTLANKMLLAWYFWLTLQKDAHQLGMDIVGPFSMALGQRRFLLIAVDYFSKFGIPHKLVSDNRRQFQGRRIQAWCLGFGIIQAFTSVAYPQSNRQTEVIYREIVRGLKVKLDNAGGDWVDEL
ncbi:uncharacterized protein LOC122029047 [Zingiber officinale]|uniref:uncharacterized protein LOC122029047 n=1 Tax=Zingiber officinale TaxID=94328 RepID=UPI001C4B11E4|nr:uncharacterized protein LOC122029047 [Zingiber officinale]